MNKEQVLYNAQIIQPDRVVSGTLVMSGGVIKEISNERYSGSNGIDCNQDYIIPGLIEMHTDNLEKYFVPRPGIYWPSVNAALIAHDNQIFSSGITTVLDAVALGFTDDDSTRSKIMDASVEVIKQARENRSVRADHFLHLRCELPSTTVFDMFENHAQEPLLKLVSIMDHTPGQRQWRDLPKWRLFNKDRFTTDEQARELIETRRRLQLSHGNQNRKNILEVCRLKKIPVASHDDTTIEHCREAFEEGVTISEFPTTLEAAEEARELGMGIIMGAPNMVRGQSHSGNISADSLAQRNLLDGFSSDYMPISLLHSAFVLHQNLEVALPKALSTVTCNIAQMVRLTDRGALEPGKKADVIRIRMLDSLPIVRSIWKNGALVLNN
jgi:alpha-D-ribose 1-methylphosphonate 5-triphosphate diphosphatase